MIISAEKARQVIQDAWGSGWSCCVQHNPMNTKDLSKAAEWMASRVEGLMLELAADEVKQSVELSESPSPLLSDAVSSLYGLKPHPPAEERTDDRYDVKLVDASGCLRLDCNGHRVHLSREQARDLMLKLAAGLDDGAECVALCNAFSADTIKVDQDERGVYVSLKVSQEVNCVVLDTDGAEKIGRGLLALSLERKGS